MKNAVVRAVPDLIDDNAVLVKDLAEMQRMRVFCITSQSRCDRSIEALIARHLGYHTKLEEAARKKLFKVAAAIRLRVEQCIRNGDPAEDDRIPDEYVDMIHASYVARAQWDTNRERIEKDMESMAKELPIAPWAKDVRGLGLLGLAVLIGEAGYPLDRYRKPSLLWKRFGLACFDGKRQNQIPQGLDKDETRKAWEARGYSPKRRAQIYAFLDDSLLRAQWRGQKIDKETGEITQEARALGPYGAVYAERKAWNQLCGKDWSDQEARRFMAKRLVLDMWLAWREAVSVPKIERRAA